MDLVLSIADHYFFTPCVYPATWPEDDALRQILGLLAVTNLGAAALYLVLGSLSYYFNQVRREICYAMQSLPWISLPTVALFFAEIRGYSKLYDSVDDSPYGKMHA
ncbi:Lathosterol oxidase [Acipenser ruthenus]|uniref:Lathosterol oxidase n=1 Tax=Acipenser ruthenus TaxID=7906 RepID=A0A444UZ57_ACIRT|nr:Lathosterol oxidase [Acipenser ruthenus]